MKSDINTLRVAGTVSLVVLAVAACGQGAPTGVATDTADATDAARDTHGFIQSASFPAGSKASGTFAPAGPPLAPPVRVNAGGHCIVDLRQAYTISGTLSGSLEIDFRILTYGPCPAGPPAPGTFDEVWIARGTFTGTFDEGAAAATFSYVANVRAGGDVKGTIVLGDGLTGALKVRGNFADGLLSYDGRGTPEF